MRRSFILAVFLLVAACGSSGASAPPASSNDAGTTPPVDAAAMHADASAEAEAGPALACSATDPRNPPITLSVQPDDGETPIVNVLTPAQHSIRVMIYDLGTSQILSTLVAKAQAKLQVKVILDATEQDFDQDAYNQLTAAGAQVQWSNPKFTYTHAKTIVVDEQTSVISTGNFDAEYIADERNYAMIDSDPQDVANLVTIFDSDWANTTPNLSCTRLVVSPVNSQDRIVAEINSATQTLDVETLEFSDVPVQAAVIDRMKAGVTVRLLVADPGFSPGHDAGRGGRQQRPVCAAAVDPGASREERHRGRQDGLRRVRELQQHVAHGEPRGRAHHHRAFRRHQDGGDVREGLGGQRAGRRHPHASRFRRLGGGRDRGRRFFGSRGHG